MKDEGCDLAKKNGRQEATEEGGMVTRTRRRPEKESRRKGDKRWRCMLREMGEEYRGEDGEQNEDIWD